MLWNGGAVECILGSDVFWLGPFVEKSTLDQFQTILGLLDFALQYFWCLIAFERLVSGYEDWERCCLVLCFPCFLVNVLFVMFFRILALVASALGVRQM